VRARLDSLIRRLRAAAPDLAFLAGLAVASTGVALVYLPAGLIVAGVSLSGCVLAAERGRK
jgi:hypothetical protein